MDIQMIGGPYGVACYICSYICKAEPDNLKNALADVLSSFDAQNPPKPLREKNVFNRYVCFKAQDTFNTRGCI